MRFASCPLDAGRLAAGLLVVAATCSVPAATASTCTPHELGADRRGPATALARSGDLVYLGAGAALVVADVSDPAAPVELGYANLDRLVYDLARTGATVVVLANGGLALVDVGDPGQPVQVGAFDFPAPWSIGNVAAANDLAFVPAGAAGLQVIDVSDPALPALVGSYGADAAWVAVRDDRVYLLQSTGLRVLDVSDPAQPVSVGFLPGVEGEGLALSPNGGWMAVYREGCPGPYEGCGDVYVYELSNPDQPRLRSTIATTGQSDAAIAGGLLLVLAGELHLYDLADVSNPVLVGSLSVAGATALDATPNRSVLAAARHRGLRVLSAADPANPVELGALPTPGAMLDGFLLGTRSVRLDESGLRVHDLSDPTLPVEIASLDLGPLTWDGQAVRVGEFALVRHLSTREVVVVDLSDPADPGIAATFTLDGFAQHLAVADGLAYFSSHGGLGGVDVWDVSDPALPLELGRIEAGRCIENVAVDHARGYFWFGCSTSGFVGIMDLSAPLDPLLLGSLPLDHPRGADVLLPYGGELDFADFSAPVNRVDVSDPSNPVWLTPIELLGGDSPLLTRYGSRLSVASGGSWPEEPEPGYLEIFELAGAGAAVRVAALPLTTRPDQGAVFAGPGRIAVAEGAGGFAVFESCSEVQR
jgi:hypothetical protein